MLSAPTAAIDLPSKAFAWQGSMGGVWLSCNDPEYLQHQDRLELSVLAINRVAIHHATIMRC